jgi:hypothetical protein
VIASSQRRNSQTNWTTLAGSLMWAPRVRWR